MPSFPTLTINDPVIWARILKAFNNDPEEYKTWLRSAIRAEVESRELLSMQESARVQQETRIAELRNLLNDTT